MRCVGVCEFTPGFVVCPPLQPKRQWVRKKQEESSETPRPCQTVRPSSSVSLVYCAVSFFPIFMPSFFALPFFVSPVGQFLPGLDTGLLAAVLRT